MRSEICIPNLWSASAGSRFHQRWRSALIDLAALWGIDRFPEKNEPFESPSAVDDSSMPGC